MSSPGSKPLLSVEDVSVSYGNGASSVAAIEQINLEIMQHESIALVGPSGCGKSTLLRVIAGLEAPATGTVHFQGEQHQVVSRDIALVLQDYGLFPWKTVIANVMLGLQLRDETQCNGRAMEMLETLGIPDKANSFPGQLSGGQRQRVALARALVLKPKLLLLDEPFAALDSLTRETLQDLLAERWRSGSFAMLTVTHNLSEAAFLGQRIEVMSASPGRLVSRIDNPNACSADCRESDGFAQTLKILRQAIRSTGAVAGAGA